MKEKKQMLKSDNPQIPINIKELIPLNKELYNDFSIDELEHRLETKLWGCDCNGGYWQCPLDAENPR